jgi:NAD(P)-dependent dehydrogenase (short-subunit alcohol dehydrogenase family)
MTAIAGSVSVITGGASGIGRGIAEEFVSRGSTVVIADVEVERLRQTASELGVEGIQVDVSDADSVENLAARVEELYGHVDIVVNNAGVGPQARIADLSLSDWQWLLGVNLYGVINGVHSFLPRLQKNISGGHIVNTSSMSAYSPLAGLGAYAVAKSGVAALTEVLAAELAADESNIHATLLVPGSVRTGIANSLRNKTPGQATAFTEFSPSGSVANIHWLEPRDVGRITARAVEENLLYAITHPEQLARVEAHNAGVVDAFSWWASVE